MDPPGSPERAQTTLGTGTPAPTLGTCRYCNAPALHRLEIQAGDGLRFPLYAEVCELHKTQLQREQPESVDRLRRKRARKVPQLSIFDTPGLAADSAIRGG